MSDVPRETGDETPGVLAALPDVAHRLFPPERLGLVERYAELLATDGVVRGLIGPREAPRLWERHLLNCAVLQDAVPPDARVCDVGSGAGLPGVVLALARPDLRVTLVEPMLRRTTFLQDVIEELGLPVDVVRGRAEALHGARVFDVVTSRAVAPLRRLVAWSMPLVAPSGALIGMKGSSVHEEIRDAADAWPRVLTRPEVLTLGSDALAVHTLAVRVAWADPARVGWPTTARPVVPVSDGPEAAGARRGKGSSPPRRPRRGR